MLSHLKAREMNEEDQESSPSAPAAAAQQPSAEVAASINDDHENEATRVTCDVLCSLGSTSYADAPESSHAAYQDDSTECSYGDKPRKGKACPKQHQLPMFLSSK
jgi:hypothetical protein